MSENNSHKAGFVTILGKPNAGKSTLMNALIGERLSITTAKAQTTRHRIMGMISGEDFQLVYSDTPGILEPKYPLQERMMAAVHRSLEDADLVLVVMASDDAFSASDPAWDILRKIKIPWMVVLNKIDLLSKAEVEEQLQQLTGALDNQSVFPVSALQGTNVDTLFNEILTRIPVHPAYFPKDELSDRSERFFASEIIREKIFEQYKQEIPYSTEVIVESFKEEDKLIRIRAELYVERQSQKGILIGKGGAGLKKLGIESRKELESFFSKQVYLETHVKVAKDWRKQDMQLRRFGYDH